MFGKFSTHFFSPKNIPPVKPEHWIHKQLLDNGLDKKFTPTQLLKSQKTIKVFYNQDYFLHENYGSQSLLQKTLTKIPAVNVGGDQSGFFQDGTPFPKNARNFFANISSDHPELLSPTERIIGAKKIIYSLSSTFASGGYPAGNPRQSKKSPDDIGIFSLAGASFENTYLHYSRFMLDPINHTIKKDPFAHWYDNLPTTLDDAQSLLGTNGHHPSVTRLRTGFPWLTRSAPDKFSSSMFSKNAVIFLSDAYDRHQLEDISMLLTAVNDTALKTGKPALLKATAVGMGFFAKIDGHYDIQHTLYPAYLRAYKKLLTVHSFPGIKAIEFPIFNEYQQEQFDNIMEDYSGEIKVYHSQRDVLEFTSEEQKRYFTCCINPSDANAYTGNEWGDGSVEAMIGNNSSLRYDQVHLLNPLLKNQDNHIAILINKKDFGAEIIDTSSLSTLQL